MSSLSEFRTGVVEVEIEGKKLPIKPLKEDKWKILELTKKKGTEEKKEELTEEKYNELREVLKKILKQGLEAKGETPIEEELENFITIYEDELLMKLSIVFKWVTEKQLKDLKQGFLDGALQSASEPRKTSEESSSGNQAKQTTQKK